MSTTIHTGPTLKVDNHVLRCGCSTLQGGGETTRVSPWRVWLRYGGTLTNLAQDVSSISGVILI